MESNNLNIRTSSLEEHISPIKLLFDANLTASLIDIQLLALEATSFKSSPGSLPRSLQ